MLTAAASVYQMQGINNVLSKHPEIKVVSNQAADWDATKAKNIAATVHPAASRPVRHRRLLGRHGRRHRRGDQGGRATGKVYLATPGGGDQKGACDGLKNGTYSEVVVYDVPGQARDMAT